MPTRLAGGVPVVPEETTYSVVQLNSMVGEAVRRAARALALPHHLAQAFHRLVVRIMQRVAPVGQQLHGLTDAGRLVLHVADRVDVDQRADPGDQQHEGDRQRVDHQASVDVEPRDGNPRVQVLPDRPRAFVVAQHREQHHGAEQERHDRQGRRQQVAPSVGAPAAGEQDQRPQQRQRDHQPEQRERTGGSGGAARQGRL